MKISEILHKDSILLNYKVDNKNQLLEKLVDIASGTGKIIDKETTLKEVIEREKIMSTGIGKNIALPHAKTNNVSDSVGALALLEEPLDFEAIDGEPVNLVFMLLGRENNVSHHLKLLSKVSRLMNIDEFRLKLFDCQNSEEIIKMFDSMEEMD